MRPGYRIDDSSRTPRSYTHMQTTLNRRNTDARFRCQSNACISLNFHFSFICRTQRRLNGLAALRRNKFFVTDCCARPSLFNAHVVYDVKHLRVCVFAVSVVLRLNAVYYETTTQSETEKCDWTLSSSLCCIRRGSGNRRNDDNWVQCLAETWAMSPEILIFIHNSTFLTSDWQKMAFYSSARKRKREWVHGL